MMWSNYNISIMCLPPCDVGLMKYRKSKIKHTVNGYKLARLENLLVGASKVVICGMMVVRMVTGIALAVTVETCRGAKCVTFREFLRFTKRMTRSQTDYDSQSRADFD